LLKVKKIYPKLTFIIILKPNKNFQPHSYMTKPLIFFAYANQQDHYLQNLVAEESSIRNLLSALHDFNFIEFFSMGSTSMDDLFQNATRFRDRLAIFHYSGHAGDTMLELVDGEANAKGFSKLLGQQEALKLVFLNGCSTKAQVAQLQAEGVPAVIATSSAIDDTLAKDFAIQFYRSLANRGTIGQSFEEAVSRLVAENRVEADAIRSYRTVVSRSEKKNEPVPWGLYVKEESALQWKVVNAEAVLAAHQENASKIATLKQAVEQSGLTSVVKNLLEKRVAALQKNWESLNDLLEILNENLNLLDPITQSLQMLQVKKQIEQKEQQLNAITGKIVEIEKQLNG